MIEITTKFLPNGEVGDAYTFTLEYTSDPPATHIEWTVSNELPAKLALDSKTGELTGICKNTFYSTLTFTVVNLGNDEQDQKNLTLYIDDKDMIPIGSIIPYAGTSDDKTLNDQGWLLCDGRTISRTDYSDLFQIIKITYGTGDGVSSFNLPDYRGQFLRGVSGDTDIDPDKKDRISQSNSNGGNGDATGNSVGSFQEDEFKSHSHQLKLWSRSFQGSDDDDKPFDDQGSKYGFTEYEGGKETRPKNVYVYYLIKWK